MNTAIRDSRKLLAALLAIMLALCLLPLAAIAADSEEALPATNATNSEEAGAQEVSGSAGVAESTTPPAEAQDTASLPALAPGCTRGAMTR